MENYNFWTKIAKSSKSDNKPFFCLAPMADVTDPAYRRIIAKYGKPDIMWTEMVSCDGMVHEEAKHKFLKDLVYSEEERPIIAQIFGSNPDNCRKTAKIISELGFDGIDINMGCPDKNINKQGAGAGIIRTPTLAKEVILATKEGAGKMPVSVKTRIGYSKNEIETWLPDLLETKPVAITIHGRTRKEMSKVPTHWDIIKRGAEIAQGSGVFVIGNGDVKNTEEGINRAQESGVDGIMIGRGIFGNPWLFNNKIKKEDLPLSEILKVMLEHSTLFEELLGGKKSFLVMRKHFGSYIGGFPGARELRIKLMKTESAKDVENIVKQYL
ncbi:MAG: tRNA-dihydrouridine synthase [bacterium]